MPPSMEELGKRLKRRHSESSFDLNVRMQTATEEIKQISMFDYVVYSQQGKINRAAADIMAIITAEKCRVTPREINLE